MLMDILMEALMSMDDESLDYVLESCDAEELEIIDSAVEAFNIEKTKQNLQRIGNATKTALNTEITKDNVKRFGSGVKSAMKAPVFITKPKKSVHNVLTKFRQGSMTPEQREAQKALHKHFAGLANGSIKEFNGHPVSHADSHVDLDSL